MSDDQGVFNRSQKLLRSPSRAASNNEPLCPVCKRTEAKEVYCIVCKAGFHAECVSSTSGNSKYVCATCEAKHRHKNSERVDTTSIKSTTVTRSMAEKMAAGTKPSSKASVQSSNNKKQEAQPISSKSGGTISKGATTSDTPMVPPTNLTTGPPPPIIDLVDSKGVDDINQKVSKAGSRRSSRLSSRGRHELALLKLEQERKLAEAHEAENRSLLEAEKKFMAEKHRREQEFLAKTMELAEQAPGSSRHSGSSMSNSMERTKEWINGNGRSNRLPSGKVTFTQLPREAFPTDAFLPSSSGRHTGAIMKDAQHQSDTRKATAINSVFDRDLHDPRMRSSTPAHWLGARSGDEFVHSFKLPGMARESYAEANATHLTSKNITSRAVLPKELPVFSGNPQEWPLFISSYVTSTKRCGFSDEENLIRLQKALKGPALEMVRAKLLLPEMVPNVLNTLRMMYGRPELILYSALQQVRSQPAVKPEALDQLVRYALTVQNLCATMEAAQLQEHLRNPMLMQELVEKLPATIKLYWAMYKRSLPEVDITIFARWLFEIAEAACEVTPAIPPTPANIRATQKQQPRVASLELVHAIDDKSSTTPSHEVTHQKPNDSRHSCPVCEGTHRVSDCAKFAGLPLSERWKNVLKHRLCGKCLGPHYYRRCSSKKLCSKIFVKGCTKFHHPLVHRDQPVEVSQPNKETTQAEIHAHHTETSDTLFRIVPVKLHGRNGSTMDTFAFLDEGSSVTLLDEEVARILNLEGPTEDLCLKWTGNTTKGEPHSRRVAVDITSATIGSKRYKLSDVRTVSQLNLPLQTLDMDELRQNNEHLLDVPVHTYRQVQPRILIGLAHWSLCLPQEAREGKLGDVIAAKCRLGWSISGKISNQNQVKLGQYHACECSCEEELHQTVKRFFSLEHFGIRSSKMVHESNEDRRAREILRRETFKDGDRYVTSLLWRKNDVSLPDSYPMAFQRLLCLERKLARNPELKANLTQQITDYQSKGYSKKLTPHEAAVTTPRTWYLPLFAVTNPNKPGKVRMVWDAAAKVHGVSLNSELMSGPDLLTALPNVLRQFREKQYAVSGDIREMFHQVRVSDRDQDSQRFLWRSSPDKEPEVHVMRVMTFGASCSPAAAQYVKNLNASMFEDQFPRAADAIQRHHYVDDWLDSFATEDEAILIVRQVKEIHAQAGFDIRNWTSNSTRLVGVMGERGGGSERSLECGENGIEAKVLGMWWQTSDDTLYFNVNLSRVDSALLDSSRKPTKREVLRILMSIFDPLGLIAVVLVHIKILLQDIWRSAIGWDEPITEDHHDRWMQWTRILPTLSQIRVPRCYNLALSQVPQPEVELHIFVDASENAYAAVAYYRILTSEGGVCALVGAKTKVAPQKPLSIPRLELQGAVLGTRLADSIQQGHSIQSPKRIFWTDSSNVLAWIRSDARKYKPFVAFRIGEILESSEVQEWRYVPTRQNVADDATKWSDQSNLRSDSRWFQGPDFLSQPPEYWPQQLSQPKAVDDETKCKQVNMHIEDLRGSASPDPNRIKHWRLLVRTQAIVLRILSNGWKGAKQRTFSTEELLKAELEIVRTVQKERYEVEIRTLEKTVPGTVDRSSTLYKLTPLLDEQRILRMGGRIDRTPGISFDQKFPILLPKDHIVTTLLLTWYHERFFHHDHETVVNEVRQRYWIPQLRAVLKRVRAQCQNCKNSRAKPQPPLMAELPEARLAAFTRPFTWIGLDFFGPMEVTVGRRVEKRWGALFTCLTVRAVHIEIAHSLSSDSAIMCIRQFIARRGMPREIWSDNGTNFRGADNELTKSLANVDLQIVATNFEKISWKFNPPGAPHMGGAWERLVRSIKTTLKAILASRRMTDELLRCCLAESENQVNSRPLTYIPIEPESPEALTPNHFLQGSSSGAKPIGTFSDDAFLQRANWKKAQFIADSFWRRWIREYLPTITRRTKWYQRTKPIQIGDIGMIWDENLRGSWRMGRVVDVIYSRDKQVRQIAVRTQAGTYRRPASKFAVLDVQERKDGIGGDSAE